MAWTGVTAAALWSAANRAWSVRSVARFLSVFAVVALLHTVWDGVSNLASYALIAGWSLVLLAWVTHMAANDENVFELGGVEAVESTTIGHGEAVEQPFARR
jgi:cytochrome c biogenesis protein CcdA